MKTIEEIRLENLLELRKRFPSERQFAIKLNKSANQLNQWLGKGAVRFMQSDSAREVEEIMNLPRGWLDNIHDTPELSQPAGLDLDRIGHALTSIDKVATARGVTMEGQLGKFRTLLAFAFAMQDDAGLFPSGISDATPQAERDEYDKRVSEHMEGLIEDGEVRVTRKVVGRGKTRAGASAAKAPKAGARAAGRPG